MKKLMCTFIICCVCLSGCGGVSERAQRASRHLNSKTHQARQEFKGVLTDEAKLKIADNYFKNAANETQELEDYLHGRKPKENNPQIAIKPEQK